MLITGDRKERRKGDGGRKEGRKEGLRHGVYW